MNQTRHLRDIASRLFFLLAALAPLELSAQPLPPSATPRGVVVAFLTETCSSRADVDRALFGERLVGELEGIDPEAYRSTVPSGARILIDSIPDLPDRSTRRAVAYVTVASRGEAESHYYFLRRDSIWRIEAVRHLVPPSQRAQLRAAIETLDTSVASFRLRRADIEHLLMSDDSLAEMMRRSMGAAERLVETIAGVTRWTRFALQDVDLAKIDEYRELDDDVPAGEIVFYQVDRATLEHLKMTLGIRRIERDQRYPGLIFLRAAALDGGHYGYLHSPDGATLPSLSASDFVLLRPVADGWWLYKRIDPRSTRN